jgi:serine protease Do
MNMKLHTHYRVWIVLSVLAFAILACIGETGVQTAPTSVPPVPPTPVNQNTGSTLNLSAMIRATVQIYDLQYQNGELTPYMSGSGTLISRTGMILTNAHVASPKTQGNPDLEPDALAIGMMDQEDQPPVFLYMAEVKAVDGYMDLAVIQITSTMDGTPIDPNSLNLPFVPLGNSDDLFIGQHINIFGFPGIGGDTITFTDGAISGFNAEQDLGARAWVKTNATIAGGNSGGLAADDTGHIIGVPTIASSGGSGDTTDCRVIQDTNGDGVLNSNDTCIPIGGFINALRSVNLALPLIQAAQSGHAYVSPYGGPSQATTSGSGNESFGTVSWYNATVGADCQVQDQVSSYTSGTTAMAAGFSFSGMTDGEPWAVIWKLDGEEVFSSQYAWDSGIHGNTFTCLHNSQDPLPDGTYHLDLFAGQNLDLLSQSDIVMGGGTNPGPQPSNQGVVTVSGHLLDADSNNPISGAEVYVLNPGTTFDQWANDNYPEAGVFSYTTSDNNGYYQLPDKLAQNVAYSFVMYVDGYAINYVDNLVWTPEEALNYQLDLTMSK